MRRDHSGRARGQHRRGAGEWALDAVRCNHDGELSAGDVTFGVQYIVQARVLGSNGASDWSESAMLIAVQAGEAVRSTLIGSRSARRPGYFSCDPGLADAWKKMTSHFALEKRLFNRSDLHKAGR
jgi:hypothetical protein